MSKKIESTVSDLRGVTYRDILIRPIITEKTMGQAGANRFTFEVHPKATKPMIKKKASVSWKRGPTENFQTLKIRSSLDVKGMYISKL